MLKIFPWPDIRIKEKTTAINTHDVVLRYLRFRRGNLKDRNDALGGHPVGNIIIDHCSASWGLDENLSLYRYMKEMPDEWEEKFGLNRNDPSDGPEDNDKDGYTNVEEWLNGTNPTEYIDYRKPENNKNTLANLTQ